MAYRNAADIVEALSDADRERHGAANSWQSLPGIGPKTAKVIAQAWAGREPDALVELRSAAADLGGGEIRAALRGDLHVHSNWSDGSAPIEEMMLRGKGSGPRVLRADRPLAAADDRQRPVAGAAAQAARRDRRTARDASRRCGFSPASRSTSSRTARSTRSPSCSTGSTSSWPACIPSWRWMRPAMTRRMIKAVDEPARRRARPLHGRLVTAAGASGRSRSSTRRRCSPPAADNGTAVEINSRPERRDPPTRLLNLALEIGCAVLDRHRLARARPAGLPRLRRAAGAGRRACPSTGSSTPGRPTSCSTGRPRSQSGRCGISRPGSRPTSTPRVTAALP